ncbi:LysR family transcriptional regulator [Paenibacillus sp. 1P03SA]|uniref:LysR family transcriptional regulator n=1 Tax=Paenibacillus sp. 1P03SA TaxID=3132294 RepID=UPI00399F8E6E
MESGDLKIFRTVAREGSITKAAQSLNYVQSNVTNRIRLLETELGTQLFYRSSKGMKLTAAGQNLLAYADKIVILLEEAVKSAQATDVPKGPLRLGSLETTAAIHLPQLLTRYHGLYPEVELSLITSDSHQLISKIKDYELDGAFVYGPVSHEELVCRPAFEEELVLISEPKETDLAGLLKKPLLFFGSGCSHRDRVERLLAKEGVEARHMIEFGTLEAIIGGVSAGLGVSLLPRSSISRIVQAREVYLHPIPEEFREINVVFVYRKDLFKTQAFKRFLDFLRNEEAGDGEASVHAAPEADQSSASGADAS